MPHIAGNQFIMSSPASFVAHWSQRLEFHSSAIVLLEGGFVRNGPGSGDHDVGQIQVNRTDSDGKTAMDLVKGQVQILCQDIDQEGRTS